MKFCKGRSADDGAPIEPEMNPMPMKRRTAKAHNPEIAPEAVELFQRGLRLRSLGAHDYDDEATGDLLAAQDEYDAIVRRLDVLLGTVCDVSPLDVAPGVEITGGEGFVATAPRALELRSLLMKELRRCGGMH
jgi:hypothetical protein